MTSVTLVSSEIVDSASPEWLRETLARHVINSGDRYARQQWIADYEKRHGTQAADQLRADILEVWNARSPV